MFLGKARKRKWKEEKLMKEYAKVHQKDDQVAENLPAAVKSDELSLYHVFVFDEDVIISCFFVYS